MPARRPLPPTPAAPGTPRTTIDDVARHAGVSKATVSRVLNRRDDLLSAGIAQRVRAAIEQLGYTPSPMAQALKRGRSRLIGLVVADVTNPFSVAVLRGAEKACRDAGYLVMLFNLGNEDQREGEAIQALSSYQVEGFILHTLGHDPAALEASVRHGKPVVLVDRRLGDAPLDLVGLDNAGAIRLAAEHLLAAGYREWLFVTEPLGGGTSRQDREAAFRAFVGEHEPACAGRTHESTADDAAGLDQALRALRQRAGPGRAAVISGNAVVTLRLAAAVSRLGWRLGADLGLVGFDDPDWTPFVGPGLTCIAQPTDDIGRLAAQCLIERLEGETCAPRHTVLPGHLIVRGSSNPMV